MAVADNLPQTKATQVRPWLAIAAVLAVSAVLLRLQGRLWWCKCGSPLLWIGDAWSEHTSQHLADPYTLTHVLHGLIFYGVFAWALPRMALLWRLLIAIFVEAAWEVFENTNYVIDRYREMTAALGYEGDSVANSLGDIVACGLGFILARYLGFRWSAALFVLTEVVLLVWIRDSLVLNIVMLIFPLGVLKTWQMGH